MTVFQPKQPGSEKVTVFQPTLASANISHTEILSRLTEIP